jgi:DNA repair protein RadA/Sms
MPKNKATTVFLCQKCGQESAKWLGQCPSCREWNTFVEETIRKEPTKGAVSRMGLVSPQSQSGTPHSGTPRGGTPHSGNGVQRTIPVQLFDIKINKESRVLTGMREFDRVLGGGIVNASLTLVGGDPGIGKSTLLLQVCRSLAANDHKILYISGEESPTQIKMRADRLGAFTEHMFLLCETDLEIIGQIIQEQLPDMVVIDSIQTMYHDSLASAPGSVSQVRESTAILLKIAKGLGVSIFIVGHVTKEGTVAGPRVLEHMVDTVLYFEGDRHASYRILRSVKNRFGSTDEIGVFEMREEGLTQVENPSEYMLTGRPENASGSVVACSLEGTRPLLIEIQALVCRSNFGIPRRQTSGVDFNRVNLLMAVLEKRSGIVLGGYDAYVNITGGIKMVEPAIDLGIVLAVASSFKGKELHPKLVAFGEVGLSGEVRAVSMAAKRVAEAEKLGFEICVLPNVCISQVKSLSDIKLIGVSSVKQAIELLL